MVDDVIKKGPGFILYRTTDWGPPIPYPSVPREDSINHGFFDLRNRPELAAQIPEAQRSLGLQAILSALNDSKSPLMSLGCEYRLNCREDFDDGFPFYFHSYTDLTFREAAKHSTEQQMINLADDFIQNVIFSAEFAFSFELGIQRLKHFFNTPGGYNLTLGLSGYGKTESDAALAYEFGAQSAAEAFVTISR